MPRSGRQTEKGKAFEFACAQAILQTKKTTIDVELMDSPQLSTAMRCYSYLQALEQEKYRKGAEAPWPLCHHVHHPLRGFHGGRKGSCKEPVRRLIRSSSRS